MSTLSVIRGGLIGTTAVVLPGAAYGTALVFTLRGAQPFLGFLVVAVGLVGVLAWTCVRLGHFPVALAIALTTLPFAAATLLTVNALLTGNTAGFLLQAVILAFAGGVAWAGTHLAKR
jgi:hypothetical protein